MYSYQVLSLIFLLNCLLNGLYTVIATIEIKGETEYFPQHPPSHPPQQHGKPTYVAELDVTKPSHPHKPGHHSNLPPVYNHDYHPVHMVFQPVHSTGQHQSPYKPIHVVPVTQQPTVAVTPQQQTFPLVGAVFSSVPNFMFPWNNMGNLGNLGSLGNLGNLGGLGGLGGQQCPLGQLPRCHCESLLPMFKPKSLGTDTLEIVQQSVKVNEKGDMDISAYLNNGLTIHQKTYTKLSANDEEIQLHHGDFVLKINEERYLVIYFNIDENDFSVKANVTKEPPTFTPMA